MSTFTDVSSLSASKLAGNAIASKSATRRRFLQSIGVSAASAFAMTRGSRADDRPDQAPVVEKQGTPKIVDAHLHINHFDRSIEDTIRHMDATGTERAFVLPLETGEGGVTLRAETVLHSWHLYPERIIPFCQTDIRRNDFLDRVQAYHRLGCRGVGEQKEHLSFGDRRVEALIALCDELDWPITLHFQDGRSGYNQGLADHIETYLKRYKKVRIIGHAQTWWANFSGEVPDPAKDLYPKGPIKPGGNLDRWLSEYPNLYADLSAGSGYNALTRDEDYTARFFERHPKQILFGSDCPCRDGLGENFNGVCYSTQLQTLLKRLIPDADRLADAFRNNALRALGPTV